MRWSISRVLGGRAHGEFVHIGLSQDHDVRRPEPGHDRGVVWRLPSLEDPRASSGGLPVHGQNVLQRQRHSRQRSDLSACCDLFIHALGLGHRRIRRYVQKGVHNSIHCGDALKMRCGNFLGADFLCGDGSRQHCRGLTSEVFSHCRTTPRPKSGVL